MNLVSLIIILGMGFWNLLNEFMRSIVDYFPFLATALSTKNPVVSYLEIYLVTGIIEGWMIGKVVLSFKRNLLVLGEEPDTNT
jgi:hypothetical protein